MSTPGSNRAHAREDSLHAIRRKPSVKFPRGIFLTLLTAFGLHPNPNPSSRCKLFLTGVIVRTGTDSARLAVNQRVLP